MTRDARSLESIAPRHHGWTRVADAPITASLQGCAFRPVTSSGILFVLPSRVATPLLGHVARYFFCLLPLRGFDREGVLRLEILLERGFSPLCNRVSP
jgi:hypothetical protein